MGLRTIFKAALPGIFAAAGEEATFTKSGGVPVDCNVFIDFNVQLQPSGMDTQVWQQGTVIEVCLSEIGDIEPDRGDVFVVDAVTYTVQAISENDGITVKVIVT